MLAPCELYLVTEDGQECVLPLFYNTDDTLTEDLEKMLSVVLIGSIFRIWVTATKSGGKGQIPLSAVYINKFDETGNPVPVIDFQSICDDGRFDGHLTTYANLTTGSSYFYKSIFDFFTDNGVKVNNKYKISCCNYYADNDENYRFHIVKIGGDLRFFNINDKLIYVIQSFTTWRVDLNKFLKGVKPYGEM